MLKKYELNRFSYKAVSGKVSEREAFIVSTPFDSYIAYTLEEYNKEEQKYFAASIKDFMLEQQEEFQTFIQELGVANEYRRFKEEGVAE